MLTLDFWYMRPASPGSFSSVMDIRWRPVSSARVAAILLGGGGMSSTLHFADGLVLDGEIENEVGLNCA